VRLCKSSLRVRDATVGICQCTSSGDNLLAAGDSGLLGLVKSLLVLSVVLPSLAEIELGLLHVKSGLTYIEPGGVLVPLDFSEPHTSLSYPKLGLPLTEDVALNLVAQIPESLAGIFSSVGERLLGVHDLTLRIGKRTLGVLNRSVGVGYSALSGLYRPACRCYLSSGVCGCASGATYGRDRSGCLLSHRGEGVTDTEEAERRGSYRPTNCRQSRGKRSDKASQRS
jgi:hypothetical protein